MRLVSAVAKFKICSVDKFLMPHQLNFPTIIIMVFCNNIIMAIIFCDWGTTDAWHVIKLTRLLHGDSLDNIPGILMI